jgi:hypothetical protein
MSQPDTDWEALHEEAARLMKTGNACSPEAVDFVRRWMEKVFEERVAIQP